MPMRVRLTESYSFQKNNFLSVNNQYSQLNTAIKRIERRLYDISITQPLDAVKLQLSLISESTHISYVSLAHITCLLLLNYETNEIAPCCLFFEGMAAVESPDQKCRRDFVLAVKNELIW